MLLISCTPAIRSLQIDHAPTETARPYVCIFVNLSWSSSTQANSGNFVTAPHAAPQLVDEETGSFFAARDHMGLSSMYIGYGTDGSVWFASEMKVRITFSVLMCGCLPDTGFMIRIGVELESDDGYLVSSKISHFGKGVDPFLRFQRSLSEVSEHDHQHANIPHTQQSTVR